MKRSFAKYLAVLLAAVMLLAVAGCANSASPSSAKDSSSAAPPASSKASSETASQPASESANGLPIVTEPITLTMWAKLGKSAASLASFSDMMAYQELQKRTGITLDFLHPAVGSETEQFNLLVASGDLPDLIEHGWRTVTGGPGSYINDKVIISLDDYMHLAPNLQAIYDEYPEARKGAVMDDGTNYMFPCIYVNLELQHAAGPVVRGDWLKQMGAELPVTLDDWHELLTLAKNTQFEGSSDIIPFTFIYTPNARDWYEKHIFIGAWGISERFTQENGKVVFGPTDPRYLEYLTMMNQWYNEGLIDPEFAANTSKVLDEKAMTNRAFAFPANMGAEITRYTAAMRSTNPDFILETTYYPVMNKGDKPRLSQKSDMATGGGTAITTACKYVEEAVRMLDYNYSKEGMLLGNFGIEGETYNMVNGEPVYTDMILKNPDGLDIGSSISKFTFHSGDSALAKPNWVTNQRDSLPEQIEGRKKWMETLNDIRIPPLLPTLEESNEFTTIMNPINAYLDESFANFVMGKTPLSEYDNFVNTLKGMNIDRAIEIQQAQMDRYANR